MARVTLKIPGERLALQGFLEVSRIVGEEAEKPVWERTIELEDVARAMRLLSDLDREDNHA